MPGLKHSPGLADIDVCYGVHRSGSQGVQSAMQKARWKYTRSPLQRDRGGALDTSRFSDTVPQLVPDSYSDDESVPSSPEVHEGFENLTSPPPQSIPLPLSRKESEVPPTPPKSNNSEATERRPEVRSRQPSTTTQDTRDVELPPQTIAHVNQLSPPTPDPSPPATDVLPLAMPAMEQKERPQFLHPMIASPDHHLRQIVSSEAVSFKTAQEDRTNTPFTNRTPVLPDDDMLPEHWLDSTRALGQADQNLGDVQLEETPKLVEEINAAGAAPKRRSRHDSPPIPARQNSDFDKHVSYVNGSDEFPYVMHGVPDFDVQHEEPLIEQQRDPEDKAGADVSQLRGLGVSVADNQRELEKSAEDLNNLVYKRIQEDNANRHSTVSASSGAIPVGLIYSDLDSSPRTLKRQSKCASLRGDESYRYSIGSVDREHSLRHKKARLPGANMPLISKLRLGGPLADEVSARQVSSPARLEREASAQKAKALSSPYAGLQDSPSIRKAPNQVPGREHRLRHYSPNDHLSTARETSQESPSIRKSSPRAQIAEHKLRHFSPNDRLSNNMSVRRTSLEASPPMVNRGFKIYREPDLAVRQPSGTVDRVINNMAVKRSSVEGPKPEQPSRHTSNPVRDVLPSVTSESEADPPSPESRIRRFSREERLENNNAVRRTSLDHESLSPPLAFHDAPTGRPSLDRGLPSSPRKSVDAAHLRPSTTPMSVSQFSDRTENIEVGEASGVRIYPHNNDSLLVVQHGSRPVSKDESSSGRASEAQLSKPLFEAHVDPPTPVLGHARPAHQVDSPLTNPRAAPEPPVFKFIPPTPNQELDRQLQPDADYTATLRAEMNTPQKRLSLTQRARRYSETLFPRLGSFRRPTSRREMEARDMYLSPNWRPQDDWDEYDSEEDYDAFESAGRLPRGGDTSSIEELASKKGFMPRAMSKRLPGFRGTGGFLVGNSLGLDRHGTNNRRHYVSTSSRTLSKRQSEELIKSMSANPAPVSRESLRKIAKAQRTFLIPFSGGMRARWIGTERLRARVRAMQLAREEREAEKRRQRLRQSIGHRVYHP